MTYRQIGTFCKDHVVKLFNTRIDNSLMFHNIAHTLRVFERAEQILSYYQLPERERFIVTTAALFHDVGYLFNGGIAHEDVGAEMVNELLQNHQVNERDILDIVGCILATSLPQYPSGLLQSIVCDADLFHLGTSEFFSRDALMHAESELRTRTKIAHQTWIEGTIRLMEGHHYHTQYCKMLLDKPKEQNLAKLRLKLQQISQ